MTACSIDAKSLFQVCLNIHLDYYFFSIVQEEEKQFALVWFLFFLSLHSILSPHQAARWFPYVFFIISIILVSAAIA